MLTLKDSGNIRTNAGLNLIIIFSNQYTLEILNIPAYRAYASSLSLNGIQRTHPRQDRVQF